MEAYSQDLRQRIVHACDEGIETHQEIAEGFQVSPAFIRRLLQRRRETGSIRAKPHGGGFAPALQGQALQEVERLLREQPDATLGELSQRLENRSGVKVSMSTMCRALKRLGWVRKLKSLHASEQETRRVQQLRSDWRRQVERIDPKRLVFVDESGATTAMTRRRARAPTGQRAIGSAPQGHWKVLTLLGALRMEGLAAATSVLSPTDTDVFRAFVSYALVPTLRCGDVVVWDNLSPHKATDLEQMLATAGARLMPLPPYSPDFSPIEPCWSKIKEHLRTVAARTPEQLGDAATKAFARVTARDARGWFAHCGYVLH